MPKHKPQKPPKGQRPPTEAAEALAAVAPLATRWIERLLTRASMPLTVAQYLALRAISREEVSVGELARRAGVSNPAASQLLAGLVDAGLIERGAVAGDRRRQALALTPAGERALESAAGLVRRELAALLEGIPRPEADALARLLPRVEARLSGAPPPPRPTRPPKPGPKGPRSPAPRPSR
jgi:DNA-binding MarR family transcriptional regulator